MKLRIKNGSRLTIACWITMGTLVSCHTAQTAVVSTPQTVIKKDISSSVLEKYNNQKSDFSTLYIKANVQYVTNKQNQNLSAEIKIKKNEQILVSLRFLGFTVAKALITPTQVRYYEKIKSTYYDGDFDALSQFLGAELDFYKLQNLLLGQAMDNLKEGSYRETMEQNQFRLEQIGSGNTQKTFYLDAHTFMVVKQEMNQIKEGRKLQVVYANPKEFLQTTLPLQIEIEATQNSNKTTIVLEYNAISFDEELSFPYSVPNDYKRILIK